MAKRVLAVVAATLLLVSVCSCTRASRHDGRPYAATETSVTTAEGVSGVFRISTSAYPAGGSIPRRYTKDGENVSIPFTWEDVPADTKSLAFVLVDRNPVAREFVHWMVVDMPPGSSELPSGRPPEIRVPGRQLRNTLGGEGFSGPSPPPGSGDHEYDAVIYALDVETIDGPDKMSYRDLLARIEGHVLATASYPGVYSRD